MSSQMSVSSQTAAAIHHNDIMSIKIAYGYTIHIRFNHLGTAAYAFVYLCTSAHRCMYVEVILKAARTVDVASCTNIRCILKSVISFRFVDRNILGTILSDV